jgi:hypothetical protein
MWLTALILIEAHQIGDRRLRRARDGAPRIFLGPAAQGGVIQRHKKVFNRLTSALKYQPLLY